MQIKVKIILSLTFISIFSDLIFISQIRAEAWVIDHQQDWTMNAGNILNLKFEKGFAIMTGNTSSYKSHLKKFSKKKKINSFFIKQSPVWQNWQPIANIGPVNLADAPVLLSKGYKDYWIFGRYKKTKSKKNFKAQTAKLQDYDIPLKTTAYTNQYNAPGGLKKSLGGYHAWQSKDMTNWVHHGPVTEGFSRWVTTAEYVEGKTYIYYDYPNDQDPHLYIDNDLSDGKPGKNLGLAFKDPSHGSDCTVIRDLEGKFHIIYEDWSPINARKHSWDSPLAGHSVSLTGKGDFKILKPAVDHRTKATGVMSEYLHPHWKQHPDWDSNIAKYNVHQPEQDAYGDWASICIGGQYYLFGDYHPAHKKIRVAWFTSANLNTPFEFCGEIGSGHPDPDIIFAEGKFYLATQMKTDYVSPGPWVGSVQVRIGIDTDNNGKSDHWGEWQEVKETYDYIKGYSKQIKRIPAGYDTKNLPAGFAFEFEIKSQLTSKNKCNPILDKITFSFH